MFKKGGLSQETGILSGLDSPRRSYAQGSYAPRVGYADGPRIPVESAIDKWKRIFKGGSSGEGIFDKIKRRLASTTGTGQTSTTAQNVARPGKIRGALDFFKKGFKRIPGATRTGITSLASYTPAGMTAPLATLSPLAIAAASPFIAQAAATGQRKKGMYTPEGEIYDPETGKITSSQNVDEMGFTEQELAGSDANIEFGTEEQMAKEMAKARDAKLKELQKEQISARIKRGDPVSANTAQELGVNLKTGAYDKGEREDPTPGGDKFTGDMESDLMKAYKEYAPILKKN